MATPRRRPRLRPSALAALVAMPVLVPLAVGCSDDESSSATTAATATAPAGASTAPVATMAPTDTGDLPPITPLDTSDLPPITPLETSDLPTSTGPTVIDGCPVGDWYLSQAELQAFYDTVGARAAVSFLFEGDAELHLRPDGTMSYVLTDFVLQQDAGGTHLDVRLTGTIDGVYTAGGSVLRTTNVEPNVTAEAYVDDTPMDATTVLQSFLAQFPFNEASYECSGAELVMDVPVLGTTHSMTLTPTA